MRRDSAGSVRSNFLWEGENLLAELRSVGDTVLAEYSYYPGVNMNCAPV